MPYKHGAYGYQVPTGDSMPISGVATLPVYVGTAPVQQLADFTGTINTPLILSSYDDAKAKIGYSDNWGDYSLCEAVYAHFRNKIAPVGPIAVINVLDPDVHKVAADPASVVITNGVGYINDNAVLSSIAITGKVLGTDFDAEYVSDGVVKITALTTLSNPSTVNYSKINKAAVTNSDIIGAIDADGKRTGMECVDLIYTMYNMIPTIILTPGWSHVAAVKTALCAAAIDVNGHWDLLAVADIESSTTKTIAAAKTWKDTNGYTDPNLKIGWPKAKSADKVFWLSTLMAVRMMQTDMENDDVPYESPSNKPLDIVGACFADGNSFYFDEIQANDLNSKGITTVNYRSGAWALWGPHCANYSYGAAIDASQIFDAQIRMMMYMTNTFQNRYAADVDDPLTRSKVDTILNDAQTWIDGLVADGKMLLGTISFKETSNPISSMVTGDFVFDIQTTFTPVAKSLTFAVQYTTQGFSVLFGGES